MATSRTSAGVGLGVGIFLLALATAAIHLYLGLSFGNTLFVLNGLGYLGYWRLCSCRSRNWHAFDQSCDGCWWATRR